MTILIGAAVFFAWAYFWVRGALWAALPPIAFAVWFTWGCSMGPDGFTPQSSSLYITCAVVIAASVAPFIFTLHRQRRLERTLHGVSFFSRLD